MYVMSFNEYSGNKFEEETLQAFEKGLLLC